MGTQAFGYTGSSVASTQVAIDKDVLAAAADFCRLVDAPDLLAWLGVDRSAPAPDVKMALEKQRKRMQSMQGNPKFREAATFLIKNYRRLEEALADPAAYLEAVVDLHGTSQLPLLVLAIDGVLADGVLTAAEATFVRDQALRLGIAGELFDRVLRERCEARGVEVPESPGPAPVLPAHALIDHSTGMFRVPLRTLQMAHRAAGAGWWDDTFTRLLMMQVPAESRRLVDLSSGLAWVALTLLPGRPDLEYLGVDPHELHVDVARKNLAQAGLASRALVHQYDPANLPLPDSAVDVVTIVMGLQGHLDTRPLLRQAARILTKGGRLVVVEPDCLAQQFWFDGPLSEFGEAFRALCTEVDQIVAHTSRVDDPLGQPGIALGPQLPTRMRAVGLSPEHVTLHPVQTVQHCSFPVFAKRLTKRVEAMRDAGGLPKDHPVVTRCTELIIDMKAARPELAVGTGVHLLPLFVVVGFKD
jgi:SAM-dependent methyltransferase